MARAVPPRRHTLREFFTIEPRWWVRDLLVAVLITVPLAVITFVVQGASDDRRARESLAAETALAQQQTRLDNAQFVREHSSAEAIDRPFEAIDLTRTQLGRLHLAGAQFGGAVLTGADLRESELQGADFTEADLRGADLGKSELSGARFFAADLAGAQLLRQGLSSVDDEVPVDTFENADLTYAKVLGFRIESLGDLTLHGTQLYGSDLSAVPPEVLRKGVKDVCYDDTTVWPTGYTPPPSASERDCTRGWLHAFYGARRLPIPWGAYGLDPD
jgi:uncharacterized protein YjbI with pentapeptide repeats